MGEINLFAIIAATIVMFAVGAFWYMVPFAKAWTRIMKMDSLTKEQLNAMQKKMGLSYGLQFVMTVLSAGVLAYIISNFPEVNYLAAAFFLWLGFVLPADTSSVLFSQTEDRYKMQQLAIMSGEALIRLLLAAWVIQLF